MLYERLLWWLREIVCTTGHGRETDTIPRTTLDLNHALYFYDATNGCLSDRQLRNVLHIVDGVVAGEGYGPLRPSPKRAGVIIGGWNPLAVDVCGARLMGLDAMRVPLLNYGATHGKSRLVPQCTAIENIRVMDDGIQDELGSVQGLGFRIPEEWESAIIGTQSEESGSRCGA